MGVRDPGRGVGISSPGKILNLRSWEMGFPVRLKKSQRVMMPNLF